MNRLRFILIYIVFLSISALSQSVLILEDGGTEDSVYSILTSSGINTTLGGNYWEYTGAGINLYGLVIFLNGVEWGETMDSSVQQTICDYVYNGGRLLTTEWISWGEYDYYPLIYQIIPVLYNGDYGYDEETYYKNMNHPISISLPDSFNIPSEWSYVWTVCDTNSAKQAITIFSGSLSGDAVVLGRYGAGEVIHWNMAGQYDGDNIWSPEIKTLLINIVRYMLNIVNIDDDISLPENFELHQNYPNPFNPSTKISWQSPEGSWQTIKLYDLMGREIETIVNGFYEAGFHSTLYIVNSSLPSGVYFYQLRAENFIQTRKMILLK